MLLVCLAAATGKISLPCSKSTTVAPSMTKEYVLRVLFHPFVLIEQTKKMALLDNEMVLLFRVFTIYLSNSRNMEGLFCRGSDLGDDLISLEVSNAQQSADIYILQD